MSRASSGHRVARKGAGGAGGSRPAALALALLVPLSLPAAAPAREPLVLLLSGGGARGAAHVGVLKVLEQERVPVDAVVGTSMGALVGGLYAAGLSAAEIERTMLETDWNGIFQERPDRTLESYRRKQDERDFLVRGQLRLDRLKPTLPLGAIDGRRVVELLRRLTAPVAAIHEFSRLPIPFLAVATDLESGAAVVLERGDLVLAMRASMAVPGVFTPVEIEGRHLIDGGIAENLATGVAARLGPARIVAVDISSPPLPVEEIGSAVGVLNQAIALLMARENERATAQLDGDDLLIRPALGTFSSAAFTRAADAIRIGEEAGRDAAGALRRLAVPADEYAAWRAGRRPVPAEERRLAAAEVRGPDSADVRATTRRLERLVGAPVDRDRLRREAERARATGLYGTVDLVVEPLPDGDARAELTLAPQPGGDDSLRFGLRLFDDFEGSTDFDLGVRWIGRHVTRGDLDARVDLRLGERQAATFDVYRPVGESHVFFLGGAGGFREEPFAVYQEDLRLVRLRRRDLFARAEAGAALGRWGEIRVGVEQDWSRLRPSSDQGLDIGELRFDELLAGVRFGLDTLDDATLPGQGALVRADLALVVASDLDEDGVTFGSFTGQRAWTLGANRLVAGVESADVLSGEPRFPRVEAGGLFRLSGYAENELRGSRLAIGSLRVARELGGAAARNTVFLGGSVELGGVWLRDQPMRWEDGVVNGSAYLSIDSVLGPVFVYVGFAEGGKRSWGFTLGRQLF